MGNHPLSVIHRVNHPDMADLSINFFGKQFDLWCNLTNPGMPPGFIPEVGDSAWANKVLQAMPHAPQPILYLACDHSGTLAHGLEMQLTETADEDAPTVIPVPGDGAVLPRAFQIPKTLVVGGADCFHAVVVSPTQIGGFHASVVNTFDYQAVGKESIFTQFFRQMPPADSAVFVGPMIGACCYEWDQPDLVTLVGTAHRLYPDIEFRDLVHPKDGDKAHFDFKTAAVRILLHLGIRPDRLHIDRAICPKCHNLLYISRRQEGNGDPRRMRNLATISQAG